MTAAFSLDELVALAHGRLGVHDVPCAACGPGRTSPANRSRPVLRVWLLAPDFAGYSCARCGIAGHARADGGRPVDPGALARARAEATERKRLADADGRRRALAIWRRGLPPERTLVQRYLAEVRHCRGPIPKTIRYLPALGVHVPAMVTAFGFAEEPEPGVLAIRDTDVVAIHVTRLRHDGSGKAPDPAKIMLGRSIGTPLVLAPMNDLLGLAIVEGIEDALSISEATGLGAWAAGSASRMPALADAVPRFADCVSIVADADPDGQRHAQALWRRLCDRDIEANIIDLHAMGAAA